MTDRLIDDLVQRALVVAEFVSSAMSGAYNELVCVFNLSSFTELWWTEAALRHHNQHLSHSTLQQLRISRQRFFLQSLLKLYIGQRTLQSNMKSLSHSILLTKLGYLR